MGLPSMPKGKEKKKRRRIVKQPCNLNLLLQIAQATKPPPFGSLYNRNCHPTNNCISPHLLTDAITANATHIEKSNAHLKPGIGSTTDITNSGSNLIS